MTVIFYRLTPALTGGSLDGGVTLLSFDFDD
jgi:hypothetical protein